MPKILFINTDEPDYLQDVLFSGLVKLLGSDNVVDYPWNCFFHLKNRKYPKNLGFTSGSLFNSFINRFTSFSSFDIAIVASAKPKCFAAYLNIMDKLSSSTPVIFVDGGDFSEIGGDLIRLKAMHLYEDALKKRPFDMVFKREYLADCEYPSTVVPFPFGFNYSRSDFLETAQSFAYDVSFWAVESDAIRTRALAMLEDRFDCRQNGTVRNQVFRKYKRKGKKYLQELQKCKIVLNFRGVGWDTLRYWEAPAIGRFMISQKPGIVIPGNFVEGKEVVFCKDDLSDLIDLCEYYLEHEDERELIAVNARKAARERHSDLVRSKYLLDTVNAL